MLPDRLRVVLVFGAMLAHIPGTLSARGATLFVKHDAAGARDGTSWPDAFQDLSIALQWAQPNDQIWVARGTYRPTMRTHADEPRSATFSLTHGIFVYGGFVGDERDIAERRPSAHRTVLSGDVFKNDTAETPTRDDNVFHVVTADGADGGHAACVLDGFTILGGSAFGGDRDAMTDSGGGLLVRGASPLVQNCVFESNGAARFGGAIASVGGSRPTIVRCSFTSNSAAGNGGAIACIESAIAIRDCAFRGNRAGNLGGAIHNHFASPIIQESSFHENRARVGGAVTNIDASAEISHSFFLGNWARVYGGAVLNVEHSDSTFSSCVFQENGTDSEGGAVLVEKQSSPLFEDCAFIRNHAGTAGGAASLSERCSPRLVNCRFGGNRGQDAGGVSIRDADVSMANCTFVGNVATRNGGAIRFGPGQLTMTNCTLVGNQAVRGGGVHCDAAAWIANSILWANLDQSGSVQSAQIDFYATPVLVSSCVQGLLDLTGNRNLRVNPSFRRDPVPSTDSETAANAFDWGDLRLTAGSPCVDAGGNAFVSPMIRTDLNGKPRYLHGSLTALEASGPAVVDMGAHEFSRPGDHDFDFDVDLADYLALVRCLDAARLDDGQTCTLFDMDGRGEVNLADLTVFQALFARAP